MSFSSLLHLILNSLDPAMLLQMAIFNSFLWLNNISLHVYYHILNQLPIDGNMDYFYVSAIINRAAMNTVVHVSFLNMYVEPAVGNMIFQRVESVHFHRFIWLIKWQSFPLSSVIYLLISIKWERQHFSVVYQ